MDRFPGKVWVVSHKPVAVAPGLGMKAIRVDGSQASGGARKVLPNKRLSRAVKQAGVEQRRATMGEVTLK